MITTAIIKPINEILSSKYIYDRTIYLIMEVESRGFEKNAVKVIKPKRLTSL
ncbi:hypothetical protein HMPREF9373_1455 [Psychrobacter sp. 1501(2011)]|nr:hypothetical protein HMPREF9373_1455 [Psychrobacter sp. 1501(2011)]